MRVITTLSCVICLSATELCYRSYYNFELGCVLKVIVTLSCVLSVRVEF